MAGRWQPYTTYAYANPMTSMADIDPSRPTFDPKAVTRASRMPPSPPKKKPTGPLIDFNKHPDSFLVLPYGNTNAKPMNPKTKVFIDVARWVQIGLRIVTLLGAVGVLLCGIFIRGAQDTEGYIMRIPPGVDLVISLYAIYHLIRNPKNRPAGSSASYHFFALVTDAGFIPFYVFTVLMARRNYDMKAGESGRWVTMFPTDAETNKVLFTTWVTAIAVGGLHLVSTFLDMYMALVFRKIAKLPPDMNPLENNLTSRRKTKHKHKNSSISATQPLTGNQEKQQGDQNTLYSGRQSQAESYAYPDVPSPTKEQIAFIHTRTKSDTVYSPHTPASARQSRERFSMYSQPASAHQSRKNLNHRDDLLGDQDDNLTLAQRKSMLKRHSRAGSHVTSASKKEQHNAYSPVQQDEKQEATGDISMQRNSQRSLREDNWFVQADHEDDQYEDDHTSPAAPKQSLFTSGNAIKGYNTVTAYEVVSDPEDDANADDAMLPQPLRMHPPSPYSTLSQRHQETTPPPSYPQANETHHALAPPDDVERPHSRSSTPKSRRYGNLQEAAAAVRNGTSPMSHISTSPTKPTSSFRRHPNSLPSATKQYAVNGTNAATSPAPAPFSLNKKSYTSIKRTGEAHSTPVKHQSPRVISRSGVDYNGGAFAFDEQDLGVPMVGGGGGRRRDVSGKIAEEGRGGARHWEAGGMVQRKVSGVAQAF